MIGIHKSINPLLIFIFCIAMKNFGTNAQFNNDFLQNKPSISSDLATITQSSDLDNKHPLTSKQSIEMDQGKSIAVDASEQSTERFDDRILVKNTTSAVYVVCNDHGKLNGTTCKCYEGYFGSMCNTTQILVGTEVYKQTIPGKGKRYFYYPLSDNNDGLAIDLFTNNGSYKVDVCTSKDGECTTEQTYTFDNTTNEMIINADYDSQFDGYNLRVTITNSKSTSGIISAQLIQLSNPTSKSFMTVIVISIVAFVILLILGFLFSRQVKRIQNQRAQGFRETIPIIIRPKEAFGKYFPEKKFKNLKSSFSQTSCSICLEDFVSDKLCRQLYCEHIFHSPCIDGWIDKHNSCPNCKKGMTVADIEAFLKSQVENKVKYGKEPAKMPAEKKSGVTSIEGLEVRIVATGEEQGVVAQTNPPDQQNMRSEVTDLTTVQF